MFGELRAIGQELGVGIQDSGACRNQRRQARWHEVEQLSDSPGIEVRMSCIQDNVLCHEAEARQNFRPEQFQTVADEPCAVS
jgi:hypothetical protein